MKSLQIGDLTVKYPIVQGGMGVGVSLSGLASAVANQGGIGVISAVGIGMLDKDNTKHIKQKNKSAFREQIHLARKFSPQGVIGANIMLAITDFDDMFKIAVEEHLDIVFIGAGLFIKKPQNLSTDEFINTKTKIAPKVSSARAAKLIFKVWNEKFGRVPDAVVIEGAEAGGHLGFKKSQLTGEHQSLEQIIKETKEVIAFYEQKYGIKIPIIAGGGIYDGKDIYKTIQAGADAVKMGTRFVTTVECDADIAFKMQYINATKEDIILIDSPVGLPGRAIENDFIREINQGKKKPVKCGWQCLKTCDFRKVPYCIAEALFNAAQGHLDKGFAFAGTNAYKATKIETVEEVFEQLIAEYTIEEINHKIFSRNQFISV